MQLQNTAGKVLFFLARKEVDKHIFLKNAYFVNVKRIKKGGLLVKEMCNDFITETSVSTIETRRHCQCSNNTGSMTGVIGEDTSMDCNAWLIHKIGLAQAYVAPQPNAMTMSEEQSLVCGTAFGDLVQPYVQGSNLTKFL